MKNSIHLESVSNAILKVVEHHHPKSATWNTLAEGAIRLAPTAVEKIGIQQTILMAQGIEQAVSLKQMGGI